MRIGLPQEIAQIMRVFLLLCALIRNDRKAVLILYIGDKLIVICVIWKYLSICRLSPYTLQGCREP